MKKVFVFVNVICSLCLLVTALGCFVNPTYSWPFAFLGFIFPLFVVVNILLVLFWLFTKQKKFALVSFLPLLFTFPFLQRSFAFNTKQHIEKDIKIISYNVRNFDLYNWSHNKETRKKMFDLLEAEQPDILCLQEFYSDTAHFRNVEDLKKTLGMKYHFFGKTVVVDGKNDRRSWGVITLSKYPIVEKEMIDFSNSTGNACIYTDIKINDTIVRIYNMHLQSIHFGYNDYKYIDQIQDNQETNMNETKNILRKIKRAAIKRGEQVNEVVKSINQCESAKIICGDFNDTPVSYTYQKISKDMNDVHVSLGFGFGRTYSKIIPTLRIDYLFLDPSFNANSYKVIEKEYSDHYPIVSTFSLSK